MNSVFLYILTIIFNLIPPDAATFTVTSHRDNMLTAAKQKDGSWDLTADGQTMNFRIEDGKLIGKEKGGSAENIVEINSLLGVKENPDWATLNDLKIGDQLFKIKRTESGLEIDCGPAGNPEIWKVQWATEKKPE